MYLVGYGDARWSNYILVVFFKGSPNFIHVPNEFGRRMCLVRPFCLSG